MAQTNFGSSGNSTSKKPVFDKNLGVWIFIDEDGNVTQIKKSKKTLEKYYPNEATKIDEVDPGEPVVIGIWYDNNFYNVPGNPYTYSESNLQTGIAMGIGDEGGGVMAYAIY